MAQHDRDQQPPHRLEAGFTMVELLVAMVIIVTLGSIVIIAFTGTRTKVSGKETRAIASSYHQAVGSYVAQHANQLPKAEVITGAGGMNGPVNPVTKRPYLSSIPDGVGAGRVGVSMLPTCVPASSAPASVMGWVSYCPGAEPNYEIKVWVRSKPGASFTPTHNCYLGAPSIATVPRCSDAKDRA